MLRKIIIFLVIANFINQQIYAIANLAALKRVQTRASSVAAYSSASSTTNYLLSDPLVNHDKTPASFKDHSLKKRFNAHPLRKCFQDKCTDRGFIPNLFNDSCINLGNSQDQSSFFALIDILRGSHIQDENYRPLYYYLTYRINIFKTVDELDYKQALEMINHIEKMANKLQEMGGGLVFNNDTKDLMLRGAFSKHVPQELALIKEIKSILITKKDQISAQDITQAIQKSGYQNKNRIWKYDSFDQALLEMVNKINPSKN